MTGRYKRHQYSNQATKCGWMLETSKFGNQVGSLALSDSDPTRSLAALVTWITS